MLSRTLAVRSLALMTLAAGSAFAAVDPVLLNLVMPDATVLTGIQVDQSLASPFGQYVLAHMQLDDANFNQFITATGFNPTKNLTQMLAATGATGATPGQLLILGRGTFVPSQIASAAIAAGGSVTAYNGFNILTAPKQSSTNAIVFLDNSTTAIGTVAMVEGAIDRWNAKATYSGNLAAPAQTVSASNSAWVATLTPLSEFLNGKLAGNLGDASQSNLFQAVTGASGGINFGASTITLSGDAITTSPQNAQALINVMQFLVGMLQSNTQNQGAANLAGATQFSVNGSTAHISLSIPEQQAEQLFMQNQSDARAARKKAIQ